MTERFHIRIADPFGARPVKVGVVGPENPLLVESMERHCVVLKNEFDVLELIAKVNKARIHAEKEAARQAFRASAVFREADAVINKLAWDARMSEGVGSGGFGETRQGRSDGEMSGEYDCTELDKPGIVECTKVVTSRQRYNRQTYVTISVDSVRFGTYHMRIMVGTDTADMERKYLDAAIQELGMLVAAWCAPPRVDAFDETMRKISAALFKDGGKK